MPLTSTRPEIAGTFGAVASTHWLATQTGMGVLERGGNAFDAAAAAGFVLQVVEPHLNGPGGDLPVVLWSEADQQVHVVCGQGVSPAAATAEAFADLGLDAVPGTGPLAAVVPGAFGGWLELLARWGTLPLREVLAPAIGYALDGAPVLPRVSATIAAMAPTFEQEWEPSAATYLVDGAAPAPWARLRLTDLGRTYERVLDEAEAAGTDRLAQLEAARRAWYEGFVAEAVDAFGRDRAWMDTSGERHRGLLTGADLAGWRATVEEPLVGTYRDVQVAKTGPWGQGPSLLQALAVLDRAGLPDRLDGADPTWVHAVVESLKLAMADREAWYGDGTDGAALLDAAYTAERAALLDPARASHDLRPGRPGGADPRLPAPVASLAEATGGGGATPSPGVGEPTVRRVDARVEGDPGARGDTCHVDVADRWGNVVSATPSGAWLQSSPVVPGLGFPLGTRGQMFWLEQGLPSSLRPGVRPRTTLSPALALRDGRPWMAFGTPGGDQQDQWQLTFLLRAVHGDRGADLALQAAIDAPMLHTDHVASSFYPRRARPGVVVAEDRWPASTLDGLRDRGHEVEVVDGWSLGRLSAVALDGGWIRAAANPRGAQGYATGR